MRPGPPALCEGTVSHRRNEHTGHRFDYPVSQVWLDPDEPNQLCEMHWAWSAKRPAPARFRRTDYGLARPGAISLADEVRADAAQVLGHSVEGPVRMLTQVRRWGWLFNPITVFLAWNNTDATTPSSAVLEVSNTPWKERHRYPLALAQSGTDLVARFDKALHVSPFLGMDFRYEFRLADRDDRIVLDIDVIDADGDVALTTGLRTGREAATHDNLDRSLRSTLPPTHRVSAGIHFQAARLWRKGVPFVSHPKKTSPEASS